MVTCHFGIPFVQQYTRAQLLEFNSRHAGKFVRGFLGFCSSQARRVHRFCPITFLSPSKLCLPSATIIDITFNRKSEWEGLHYKTIDMFIVRTINCYTIQTRWTAWNSAQEVECQKAYRKSRSRECLPQTCSSHDRWSRSPWRGWSRWFQRGTPSHHLPNSIEQSNSRTRWIMTQWACKHVWLLRQLWIANLPMSQFFSCSCKVHTVCI